jgi:hypothetical protein
MRLGITANDASMPRLSLHTNHVTCQSKTSGKATRRRTWLGAGCIQDGELALRTCVALGTEPDHTRSHSTRDEHGSETGAWQ